MANRTSGTEIKVTPHKSTKVQPTPIQFIINWITEIKAALKLHRIRLLQAVIAELCPGAKSIISVEVAFITAIEIKRRRFAKLTDQQG